MWNPMVLITPNLSRFSPLSEKPNDPCFSMSECELDDIPSGAGVLISYILGGEIVFTHATVAIQQGSENWPLQT